MVVIISDASIKNNVVSSITHIHSFNSLLKKMLYHAISIMSTEAELFALRCEINQVVQISSSLYIIVITVALHMVQNFFDLSIHPYQLQTIVISKDLQNFFNVKLKNFIEFWDYSSNKNWYLHAQVDKKTKRFNLILLYLRKIL